MMRHLFRLIFPVLLAGCVWHNEEELYPEPSPCDTAMVSFSDQIAPILSDYCYRCHSNIDAPNFGNGLALENYEDVAANAQRIVMAINHAEGFIPMPRNGEKLPPCPISIFEAWVAQGTPDN